MGLESLFLFTLLGGLSAGVYVFETCFARKRAEGRPWLVPLVAVVLFVAALLIVTTHVSSVPRALESVLNGTTNLASGIIHEVVCAVLFVILAAVDLVIVLVKRSTPFALRAVASVVAIVFMVVAGTAYVDIYGNTVWTNAPATVISFVGGDLAAGLALYAVLDATCFTRPGARVTYLVTAVVLAVGLALEIAAFNASGISASAQVAGLVIAPVASIVAMALQSRFSNKRVLAILVCVLAVVGVAVARYSFYATAALM